MGQTEGMGFLERIFGLSRRGTDVKTELIAGVTTFSMVAYIIVVNPVFLVQAGIPQEAAIISTVFAAAFSTIIVGLRANLPFVIIPGMGLNAFFLYHLVGDIGLTWQTALGVNFLAGLGYYLLSVSGISFKIAMAVPQNLKAAIVVGIGWFIAFLGIKNAGWIVFDGVDAVKLGSIVVPQVWLSLLGLLLSAVLMIRRVTGALVISMITITALSMLTGAAPVPQNWESIISDSVNFSFSSFFQFDVLSALNGKCLLAVFVFLLAELFDTIGTFLGMMPQLEFKKSEEETAIRRGISVDAFCTMMSVAFGCSTDITAAESAAGIAVGGRTGLTALTISFCFLFMLLFMPVVGFIPAYATSPALIIVGMLMMSAVKQIDFKDLRNAIPAYILIIIMFFGQNVSTGFAFGFISYVLINFFSGRRKEISPAMWIISAAFLCSLAMGA